MEISYKGMVRLHGACASDAKDLTIITISIRRKKYHQWQLDLF